MRRLKLGAQTSQEVIGTTKLKVALLLPAGITSGQRQLRTKSVKLMPHCR
jgi:hypothetical protein